MSDLAVQLYMGILESKYILPWVYLVTAGLKHVRCRSSGLKRHIISCHTDRYGVAEFPAVEYVEWSSDCALRDILFCIRLGDPSLIYISTFDGISTSQ